jgi:hypothetical protein
MSGPASGRVIGVYPDAPCSCGAIAVHVDAIVTRSEEDYREYRRQKERAVCQLPLSTPAVNTVASLDRIRPCSTTKAVPEKYSMAARNATTAAP